MPNISKELLKKNASEKLLQLKTRHLKELNELLEENAQEIKSLYDEDQQLNAQVVKESQRTIDVNRKTSTETATSNLSTAAAVCMAGTYVPVSVGFVYAAGTNATGSNAGTHATGSAGSSCSNGSAGSLSLILKQIETATNQLQHQIREISILNNILDFQRQKQSKFFGESLVCSMIYPSPWRILNTNTPALRMPSTFLNESNGMDVLTGNWDVYAETLYLKNDTDDEAPLPIESFEWMEYESNKLKSLRATTTPVDNNQNNTSIRAFFLKEKMASSSVVEAFYKPKHSPLDLLKLATFAHARFFSLITAEYYEYPLLVPLTKRLLSFLAVVKEISGWCHVARYIDNPKQYAENLRAASSGYKIYPDAWTGEYPWFSRLKTLENTGHLLLLQYYKFLETLLHLYAGHFGPILPRSYFIYLLEQASWIDDIHYFMKQCETEVTELITQNQQKFQAFRELQRNGVAWPHSYHALKQIEECGFVYRPMMIKRDRCVCETCGVEISGLYDWFDIRSFHNFAKHPIGFAKQWGVAPPPPNPNSTIDFNNHPYNLGELQGECIRTMRNIALICYVDKQSIGTLVLVDFLRNSWFFNYINIPELIHLIVSYSIPFDYAFSKDLSGIEPFISKYLSQLPEGSIDIILSFIGPLDFPIPSLELVTKERETILNQFVNAGNDYPDILGLKETVEVAKELLDDLKDPQTSADNPPNAQVTKKPSNAVLAANTTAAIEPLTPAPPMAPSAEALLTAYRHRPLRPIRSIIATERPAPPMIHSRLAH